MSTRDSRLSIFGEWIVQGVVVLESLLKIRIWRGSSWGCLVRWWIEILDMTGKIQRFIEDLSSLLSKGLRSQFVKLIQ